MHQKTIFLTGATGFLGSNLTIRLLNLGHNLILLVRGNNNTPQQRIKQVLSTFYSEKEMPELMETKISIVEGDVTQKYLGMAPVIYKNLLKKIDEVWHCAASVKFEEENGKMLETQNFIGTKNVLAFVRDSDSKCLHHISTAYVAGKREGLIKEDDFFHEKGFKNSYEETKYKAEKLVREYGVRYALKTAIYRPSIVVGNYRTGETSSFTGLYGAARILDLIVRRLRLRSKAGSGDAIRLSGCKEAHLNLVPIDYVTDAIISIYKKYNSSGKTFHVVNPSPMNTGEVWEGIGEAVGVKVEVAKSEEFQRRPMSLYERVFSKSIRPYTPYHCDTFIFDDGNTRDFLRKTGITCPVIRKEDIIKFIAYCYKVNWGRQ